MTRTAALVALCSFVCAPFAYAQSGQVKAVFAAVPFQQWVEEGAKADLPWHPRITPPRLTLHQRIAVRVEVQLDGKELVKRCCDGQAIALVEIKDQQGRIYRNYGEKELKDAEAALSEYMIDISWEMRPCWSFISTSAIACPSQHRLTNSLPSSCTSTRTAILWCRVSLGGVIRGCHGKSAFAPSSTHC